MNVGGEINFFTFVVRNKIEIFALFFIFSVLLALAMFRLTEAPSIWYDEGLIVQPAMNLALHGALQVQMAPGVFISPSFISSGYPILYPLGLAFKFFGVGILQARGIMVMYLFLLTSIFYLFFRKLFFKKEAIFAVLLLVSFPPLYGNGKNVLGEVPGLFFLFLALYLFYKLEVGHYAGKYYWLLSGLATGLCLATKPIFLVLAPAIIFSLIIFYKRIIWNWRMIVLFLIALFVPIVVWWLTQFGGSDSLSGTFIYYANPYSLSGIIAVMSRNLLRFFTEASPFYLSLSIFVWVWAIAIRIKNQIRISFAEAVALFFTIFIILFYLRTPGWYRYFFPAQIIVLGFLPHALRTILDAFKVVLNGRSRYSNYICTVVIFILFLFQIYQTLFYSWVADAYNNRIAHNVAQYFTQFDKSRSIFLYNVPEVAIFLPTFNYYQFFALTETKWVGVEQLDILQRAVPDFVIFSSRNKEDLPASIWNFYQEDANVAYFTVLKKVDM